MLSVGASSNLFAQELLLTSDPQGKGSFMTPMTSESMLRMNHNIHQRSHHRLGSVDNSHLMTDIVQHVIEKNTPYRDTHYAHAYHKMMAMKNGERDFSMKEAVFAVENAYFNNRLSYEAFNQKIEGFVDFIYAALEQSGLDPKNEHMKHFKLFQFMSDTLTVDFPQLEKPLTHYPMTYDFEDFKGRDDYASVFVSKLMYKGSGQCRSMPLLYLILAEELGIDAHLALAPEHSYIKIQDEAGEFYNLELTQGTFVSDGFIMGSGYINANALKNKLYMDTLSQNQLLLQLLNDLNAGYVKKYGWDKYAIKQTDAILKEDPDNVMAIMHKSNSIMQEIQHRARVEGYPTTNAYTARNDYGRYLNNLWGKYYHKLIELGHQDMPEAAYQEWLASIKDQKRKQKREVKMDDNFQKF